MQQIMASFKIYREATKQVLDVVAIDLLRGIKARLGIIAVGQQKIG